LAFVEIKQIRLLSEVKKCRNEKKGTKNKTEAIKTYSKTYSLSRKLFPNLFRKKEKLQLFLLTTSQKLHITQRL